MNDLDRMKAEYERRKTVNPMDDRYALSNASYEFAIRQRWDNILALMRTRSGYLEGNSQLLEIGCGSGGVLHEFGQALPGVKSFGIDLLFDRLLVARESIPDAGVCNADGQNLPFPPASFDLVLQFTAFSSILDPVIKQRMASDMLRVLKQDGVIIWYDFWWNPTNRQTRGITPVEIRSLFPNCSYQIKKITLAPPIARRVVPLSRKLAVFLEALGIFNSHYLVLITR
jgi:ubiquinone/menaquinone biosynthesis C-methylase UbiE